MTTKCVELIRDVMDFLIEDVDHGRPEGLNQLLDRTGFVARAHTILGAAPPAKKRRRRRPMVDWVASLTTAGGVPQVRFVSAPSKEGVRYRLRKDARVAVIHAIERRNVR